MERDRQPVPGRLAGLAQRLDPRLGHLRAAGGADGARIGGDFRISGPNATSNDADPAVAWNQTANQYLVVWQDGRNHSTRGCDIYGRRVTG